MNTEDFNWVFELVYMPLIVRTAMAHVSEHVFHICGELINCQCLRKIDP